MSGERTPWPSNEELGRHTQDLVKRLEDELREYEVRYDVRSDRLESELQAGRLRETADVADWLIAFRTYRKLVCGRQTRME
jgi:hypothetical protein